MGLTALYFKRKVNYHTYLNAVPLVLILTTKTIRRIKQANIRGQKITKMEFKNFNNDKILVYIATLLNTEKVTFRIIVLNTSH